MTTHTACAAWIQPVLNWLETLPVSCACAVIFPSYRPDLVQAMAAALDARFVDFRKLKMAPLGWQAAQLASEVLSATAREEMAAGQDVVLHNAEALLSLFQREEREAWFARVHGETWPRRLILPLTLYSHDLPADMVDRVFELRAEGLPSEGIVQRLAGMA